MSFKILKTIELRKHHIPLGNTIHYVEEGQIAEKPSKLQIVTYPDEAGVYLLYLNANGEEITDTYHNNIEEAMKQAKWEFQIEQSEWKCGNEVV